MKLELNTNGAWRVVLTGLSRHDKAAEDRYLDALTVAQNLALGAIYTAISIARSYAVRRWFNARIARAAARIVEVTT